MAQQKKITDFKQCPHCNSNYGYFVKAYVSGWVEDITLFDGEKANYDLFQELKWNRVGKKYFCVQCHKFICKV